MMIGEINHRAPTVHVPPWTVAAGSPNANGANFNAVVVDDDNSFVLQTDDLLALRRYLAKHYEEDDPDVDGSGLDTYLPLDAYSCDNFRMYEFKIRKCARGRSHDWTDCPFAHPGEKARRRDPRFYSYSGTACPDFRKGNCKKGDGCEFAHGVFECWLHPARYRTQPCKDGLNCRRRVCFFAHTPEQLRVLSPRSTESYDGSPRRLTHEGSSSFKGLSFKSSSPEYSSSPPSESPPMSPMAASSLSRSLGSASVNDMVASLRQLHLNKVKSMSPSWGIQMGSRFPITRPGFSSLPTTPTRPGVGLLGQWDKSCGEEVPVMERVESGRGLRAKLFEKLSKENPLDRFDPNPPEESNPDLGWVSDLVT